MKLITLFKILAIGLALLIVAGLLLVAHKIANPDTKGKRFPNYVSEIGLLPQEQIDYVVGCGDYLCAITKGEDQKSRVLVITPKNGQIQSVVQFKEEYLLTKN